MYIELKTLNYPVYEHEIRARYSNVSFPVPFDPPSGYAIVVGSERPSYDPVAEGIREAAPKQVNGVWTQQWEVFGLDEEQVLKNREVFQQRLKQTIVDETQNRLDEFARERGYDGIMSLCTYAASTNPRFQAEGQLGIAVRDQTWSKLYEIMEDIENGQRELPVEPESILLELPPLTWT